ncbi:MAG: DNA topoisomerase IV subunit A [Candidatus Altiarchaeota archaeon]|nr:DNA topoisomerase IV subunit A [Candidatus Altiarchaeota archaeon]
MERKEAQRRITELSDEILANVSKGENPFIKIPVRGSSNVIWDQDKGLLSLGDKESKRFFINVAHARKFMQTLLVASFSKQLLSEDVHASLRESFYSLKHTIKGSKENTFEEQGESDATFVDLEVALDILRDELHINADRRGVAAGHVIIEDRGDEINWSKLGSGGWAIPGNVEDIKFKDLNADYMLVVEKNATFDRLHEDKFWNKHNCVLIGTQGQAARGIRRLIHQLNKKFKIPVYAFTDSDPYGWYIYSVIKIGSMNLAHVSSKLGTPDTKFLGLTISDIYTYELENAIIRAKDVDIKRAHDLLKYPWFKHKEWEKEIKLMIKKRVKAEQEALAQKHLKFVSETYLPEKIENKEFLP